MVEINQIENGQKKSSEVPKNSLHLFRVFIPRSILLTGPLSARENREPKVLNLFEIRLFRAESEYLQQKVVLHRIGLSLHGTAILLPSQVLGYLIVPLCHNPRRDG